MGQAPRRPEVRGLKRTQKGPLLGAAGEGQQAGQQAHAGQDPAPHMHTGDCACAGHRSDGVTPGGRGDVEASGVPRSDASPAAAGTGGRGWAGSAGWGSGFPHRWGGSRRALGLSRSWGCTTCGGGQGHRESIGHGVGQVSGAASRRSALARVGSGPRSSPPHL